MICKDDVIGAIYSAINALKGYGDDSHEAAVALDRLREAMFWAIRMKEDGE